MILSFSKEQFRDRIISGVKIHTVRKDEKNRWKPGMKIHFYLGNPRNGGKQFGTGIVEEVYSISIYPLTKVVSIGGAIVGADRFATNDGFNSWDELKEFFPQVFDGKLIIWKEFTPKEGENK